VTEENDDDTGTESSEDEFKGIASIGYGPEGVAYQPPEPGTPLDMPLASTPLESHEPEGIVPPTPLWAMKDRRHFFGLHGHGDAERIRACVGSGDEAVYVIDDGRDHCMIGRRVGATPGGRAYCLVARVPLAAYQDMENGTTGTNDIFAAAHDITLCGVFEDEGFASDVLVIEHYRHAKDVPSEYLPPSPFIEFAEDEWSDG